MLNHKKVMSDKGTFNAEGLFNKITTSTVSTSKTESQLTTTLKSAAGAQNLKTMLRAKRQITGGTNSSMMSLVKTGENQGKGAAAKTKRPLLFGSYATKS